MIDYHNARVYLLGDDQRTLEPVAFGGNLSEYAGETFDALRCDMGEGITGTAAQRGQTLNIADAQHCEFAEDIEGSADIEESILAVPLRYERRTIGVIVLSKLGLDQFSTAFGAAAGAAGGAGRRGVRERAAARGGATVGGGLERAARDRHDGRHRPVGAPRWPLTWRTWRAALTGSRAAAVVVPADPESGRSRVLASTGDAAVRAIAMAAVRAGYPRRDEVRAGGRCEPARAGGRGLGATGLWRRSCRSTARCWWWCATRSPSARRACWRRWQARAAWRCEAPSCWPAVRSQTSRRSPRAR